MKIFFISILVYTVSLFQFINATLVSNKINSDQREEIEPNDNASQANLIELSDSIDASVEPSGDIDYYRFSANAGDTLSITLTMRNNSQFNGHVALYDINGNLVSSRFVDYLKPTYFPCIISSTSEYYIRFAVSFGDFPNRTGEGLFKRGFVQRENKGNILPAETGDYRITLKRFQQAAPVIDVVYHFNTYYNKTQVGTSINPNGLPTTVVFAYGIYTSYGDTVSGNDINWIDFMSSEGTILDLSPQFLYHLQVTATNDSGASYNNDYMFSTPQAPEDWVIYSLDDLNLFISDVSFANQQVGFALAGGYIVLKTVDGGASWTSQTLDYYVYEIHCIDNLNVIALSDYGILKTANGGLTWSRMDINSSSWLYDLFFVDANTGFVVGGQGAIFKTTDGGTTWNPLNSTTSNWLTSVSFVDALNGYVVGDLGTILKTTDGGITWMSQNSGTQNIINKVSFADVENGFALGNNGNDILKTSDAGITWNSFNYGMPILSDISLIDKNNAVVVGAGGTIYYTPDFGRSWYSEPSGTTNWLTAVSKAGNNWVAVGDYGTVLKSTYNIVSVEKNDEVPLRLKLEQNYPNPFNPRTAINYTIPKYSFVTLAVYDILGRKISSLVNEEQLPGVYEIEFDASNLSSGIYFYRIQAGELTETKKFILLR